VHVSFILNNGKLSPRRADALSALEMIDPKKNPFNCTSKKDERILFWINHLKC